MALITEDLRIPTVSELFPTTRRWRRVRPCGTAAAYRRHFLRGGKELPVDDKCANWHMMEMRARRAIAAPNEGWRLMPDILRFGSEDPDE